MMNQDPLIPTAVLDNDPRGSLFWLLLNEFKEEISAHSGIVGLEETETYQLETHAEMYIDGLREHRENIDEAAEHFLKRWTSFRQENADNGQGVGRWRVQDFFVTTPIRLEKRVHDKIQKAGMTLDQMRETARREAENDKFYAQYFSPNQILSTTRKNELRVKIQALEATLNYAIEGLFEGILTSPTVIIAICYEAFLLSANHQNWLRDKKWVHTYLSTYSYLDSAALEKIEEGGLSQGLQKRLLNYVGLLKERAGDIKAMGDIVRERLDENVDRIGGSKSVYIDPFYPTDLTAIEFPSAQADFVAARLIAEQAGLAKRGGYANGKQNNNHI